MIFLLAIGPTLVGLGLWMSGVQRRRMLAIVAATALAATGLLAGFAGWAGWEGQVEWTGALEVSARLTTSSALVAVLVPLIGLPVIVYTTVHESQRGLRRLVSLLLVFIGGMQLLVMADDFLTLLIAWELVGACSWALIAHDWREADNPASALYAFVTTRLGDVGLILAAVATYAATGGFGFDGLASLQGPTLEIVAFGLVVSAAAKSGQLPFSPWLFRAMAGPTPVSALLHSATMVAAGAYLLARLAPELDASRLFAPLTLAIGLATALGGGLVAVLQSDAKRLLAASTSAQYGLMFVAVGAGFADVAILHLLLHASLKALLFLAAGIAGQRAGSYSLSRMGFLRALPFTAAASLVGALALAGVPPLGAAWTKEAIVAGAGHANAFLAFTVMCAGALSAVYATRFQLLAFGPASTGVNERDNPSNENDPSSRIPRLIELGSVYGLALLTLAASVVWLTPVAAALSEQLSMSIPHPSDAETVLSLVLVGLGLLSGQALVRWRSVPATGDSSDRAADWLLLPQAIARGPVAGFERLAERAAEFDNRVFDAIPRQVAATARLVTDRAAQIDRRILDGGVRLTVRVTDALGELSARAGERVTDGLPSGLGLLTGSAGRDAQRLQTGLSHHYYTLLAIGAAVMGAILLIGV